MEDIEFLVDFHLEADRQGPGSERDTRMALELSGLAPRSDLRIADIGCGSGGQTLTLARATGAKITAVDFFEPLLKKLRERARAAGLNEQIITLTHSMEDLPFETEEFDLIWSEGAIYNMGFERGIREWKQFLKPGGCLAVSELTWLGARRPRQIEDYWRAEYPGIDTAAAKIRQLEENGYSPVGYFTLSPESWLKTYFGPMENRYQPFLERHQYSEAARQVVAQQQEEIRIYKQNQEYFSYGFYIARRLD